MVGPHWSMKKVFDLEVVLFLWQGNVIYFFKILTRLKMKFCKNNKLRLSLIID